MSVNQWMLELSDPMDCEVRGHGTGSIRVMVWGSLNANPQCWVRLYKSGKMLVVDQSDLRVHGNPGDERDDGGPDIPEDWAHDRTSQQECCVCHSVRHWSTKLTDTASGVSHYLCHACDTPHNRQEYVP